MPNDTQLSIRLPSTLEAEIRRRAAAQGRTAGDFIRRALEQEFTPSSSGLDELLRALDTVQPSDVGAAEQIGYLRGLIEIKREYATVGHQGRDAIPRHEIRRDRTGLAGPTAADHRASVQVNGHQPGVTPAAHRLRQKTTCARCCDGGSPAGACTCIGHCGTAGCAGTNGAAQ
jgi:hypothetical protein